MLRSAVLRYDAKLGEHVQEQLGVTAVKAVPLWNREAGTGRAELSPLFYAIIKCNTSRHRLSTPPQNTS